MCRERSFDLAQLESHAAELHLMVNAAEEGQRPVRQASDEVAGAVHPCAGQGRERVGDEALRSEIGATEYPSARQPPPRYSSPPTPTGSGCIESDRMNACVFAIGRPIGSGLRRSPGTQSHIVASTVASVGPYW